MEWHSARGIGTTTGSVGAVHRSGKEAGGTSGVTTQT